MKQSGGVIHATGQKYSGQNFATKRCYIFLICFGNTKKWDVTLFIDYQGQGYPS